jgi:hypothetical protein
MAFIPRKGKFRREHMPVTTSTALSASSLVTFTSGKLVAATAGTANTNIVGILEKAIVATDSDYASDRLVSVLVPTERFCVVEADVTSGLVAADVGLEVDLTDASTIDRAASTVDAAKVVKVISTTKGLFNLKIAGAY